MLARSGNTFLRISPDAVERVKPSPRLPRISLTSDSEYPPALSPERAFPCLVGNVSKVWIRVRSHQHRGASLSCLGLRYRFALNTARGTLAHEDRVSVYITTVAFSFFLKLVRLSCFATGASGASDEGRERRGSGRVKRRRTARVDVGGNKA